MPRFVLVLITATVCTVSTIALGVEPPPSSASSTVQVDKSVEPEKEDPRDGFDVALGAGAGVLELAHGDLRFLFSRYFYIGGGVGGFPADPVIDQLMGTSELQDLDIPHANFEVVSDTSLMSVMGFARILPFGKAFFIEGAFELWRLKAKANGTLSSSYVPGQTADLSASAKVLIPMMGAHMGWCLLSKAGIYVELMVGFNFPLDPTVEISMGNVETTSDINATQVDEILSQASQEISATVNERTAKFIKKNRAMPTAAIRIGWAFDLNGSA